MKADARYLHARARLALALLGCACSVCACSRRTSQQAPGDAAPAATVTTAQAAPAPLAPAPAFAQPATPSVPSQLLACGKQDFYRITPRALEVFEIAPHLPPPQIRGSRVARQSTEVLTPEPSNVLSLADGSVLVFGKTGLLRYELGKKDPRRSAAIAADGSFFAWANQPATSSFWLHVDARAEISELALDASSRAVPLPEFDARLFAVLADGQPLYSTARGLVRGAPKPVATGELAAGATVLFADPSPDAYWLADATGKLERRSSKPATSPSATLNVPGVVIDTAIDGDRLAVLSMALVGPSYRPAVTVLSNGRPIAQLTLGSSSATDGVPKLDVCLLPGRPWVLVGGTQWLQLLDFAPTRLLAEW